MLKTEIPYPVDDDPGLLFSAVAHRPWSAWLDSGTSNSSFGRYDIIVAEPRVTLVSRGNQTIIEDEDGSLRSSEADPFELLRSSLPTHTASRTEELPFTGGALGYFSYDLARRLEVLPGNALDDLEMPEMAIGIYDWALICDRLKRRCWLVSDYHENENSSHWQRIIKLFTCNDGLKGEQEVMRSVTPVESNISRNDYACAFERIQHYLEEGDCYQVNFAQRFCVGVTGSPWVGYQQLRKHGAGPFSAYLNTPFGQVMCTSPERFLQVRDRHVETRPIKGTRRRDPDARNDQQLRDELAASEKDRAENLMIVDLLRNDLGKSCRIGSVRVPELFSVESYATVHHLVSSVTCELDEKSDALSLLRGSFPGGSITGAPKLRAMSIIDELEPHRRGLYCGAIGYIGFNGNMDTNIVIRTAIHLNGKLYYSAGGGIVRDSSCEAEYQESFDKAAAFISCFAPHEG